MTFSNISKLAASNGHKPQGGCPLCGRDLSPEVAPADRAPEAVCGVCYIASTCPGGHAVEELRHLDAAVVHTVFACANLLSHLAEIYTMGDNLHEAVADPPQAKARHDFVVNHVQPCLKPLAKTQKYAEKASKRMLDSLLPVHRSHPAEVNFVLGHHEMGQAIDLYITAFTRKKR